jgi:hypothetical protein
MGRQAEPGGQRIAEHHDLRRRLRGGWCSRDQAGRDSQRLDQGGPIAI